MADSRSVGAGFGGCEGEGERGERGKRGHRGPAGPQGPAGGSPPTAPFALSTTTIFARTSGSDSTGDGSIETPYRTFQRAIRDVPLLPAPGASYIVDITGLGTEALPDQYALPQIVFPVMVYANDTSIPYFYSGAGLRVRALPQLASSIPAPDAVIDAGAGATITADPDTNLITLTISAPRASWSTLNLKNKLLIRTGASSAIANPHLAGCVIVSATSTSLVLTNAADPFNGGVGALALAPGEEVQIVEPSATLEGGEVPFDDINNAYGFAAISSVVNSLAFQGIKFTNRVPGNSALGLMNCPQQPLELCDIDGMQCLGQSGTYWVYANGCVIRGNLNSVTCAYFSQACHYDTMGFFYMVSATPQGFINAIFSDCAPYQSQSQGGLALVCNTAFQNVLMNAGANGGGISVTGGRMALDHVQINNVQGDAITGVEGSYITLDHVTGTGSTGAGLVADDATMVQVLDTGCTIIGVGGEILCGALANRTWANFYGSAPVGQQYDLVGMNAGALLATGTGTRVFLKP